jgi:hypothetical protein
VNGIATSASYIATAIGTDYWVATYNGDSNNKSLTSGTSDEPVVLRPISPSISTTPGATTTTTSTGAYATIGFWHNQNGQAEIKNFDSGPSSKLLGNSLASNFPHLFRTSNAYTGTSLAGLTNSQVAAAYLHTWTPSGVDKNTYVQAFAVALGAHASTGGAGSFNVGGNGAAFGVANNTVLPIGQILSIADANFNPATGLFYGGNSVKTSALNNVLNDINVSGEKGGGGSTTVTTLKDSATLSGGQNDTGTITFYLFAPGVTPNATNSNSVYKDVVTISGAGTYSTAMGNNPGGFTAPANGTYQWVVVYSGDANNSGVTSPFGSEPWKVG